MRFKKTFFNFDTLKKLCSISLAITLSIPSLFICIPTKANDTTVPLLQTFNIKDVTMTDSYCTNAFDKEVSYLLSFDTNKLLAGFRQNAGLNTYNATRYGGWENCLIAGHTLGHYLSAVAQAYNNPNLSSIKKQQLYSKLTILVDGLLECQKNSKGKPGFIWAAPVNNGNVEGQFDNVEQGKTNIIVESWVPWYTMHKLIAGLCDVYNLTNYNNAKVVASGLGDWTYNRCTKWSSYTHNKVLSIEYGGMNDCLYELYKITGKDSHATAAHYFDQTDLFELVQAGNPNVLTNRHANTTIPKFIGSLKRYTTLNGKTINGSKVDASAYLKYAESFWDNVVNKHSYITGGNSEWEHFGEDYILDAERTNCNCETCNVYNMLKLTRELFKITGDPKYMNYYETTYYNSILSSQDPDSGMTTYFQPMASGYFKVYSSPYNSFWCCTGSGMENFTKLGDTIYMHSGNNLYINLYQSSKLSWAEKNVILTQNSQIPDGDTSIFTLNTTSPITTNLYFRIPDWCAGTMTIQKNNQPITYTTVNGYAKVSDTFTNNDQLTIKIPETVMAYNLPDAENSYAFKYGPIVLSAELGSANLTKSSTGMNVTIPEKKIIASENVTINAENGSVASFMQNINNFMKKDNSSLSFTLTGTDTALKFTPHYLQHTQRYAIYLYYNSNGTDSPIDTQRATAEITDTVQPGYGQYESDALHQMNEANSVGITNDGTYRYAKPDGYFSYQMAIDETAKMKALVVTFRKEDNGKTIKIRIGNNIIYAKTLNYTGPESSYKVKILIPESALKNNISSVAADGKNYQTVTVTFASNDTNTSARVCDFIYMTTITPLYAIDDSTAYFVNCGDHNPATASSGDKFGLYNSLTEQMYGIDTVTGYSWGIIDDLGNGQNGSSKSNALYTANTWPDEFNESDNIPKTSSFRYTKNQYEKDIPRHLDYGFELPNGTYSIEIGFKNPWKCSNNPSVYANYGKPSEATIASNVSVNDNAVVKGTAKVTDGTLQLNFKSQDKAINVSYILIQVKSLDPLLTESIAPPTPVLSDGWYSIKNVNAQKYLQVTKNIGANAQNVEISSSSDAAGQKWYLTNQKDGSISLRSSLGNYNLDVFKGSDANEANIQIYDAWNGIPQKFFLSTISKDIYGIITASSTKTKALDAYRRGTLDGTNVCQYTFTGDTNQQWIFEPIKIPQPTNTPQPTDTPNPTTDLSFDYKIVGDWDSSFQGEIIVTNNSEKAFTDWTLTFDYNCQISNLWGAELVEQTGTKVMIKNPSWDTTLAPGASITIQFIATSSSDKNAPTNYTFK